MLNSSKVYLASPKILHRLVFTRLLNSSIQLADVRRECYTMEPKSEKDFNQRGCMVGPTIRISFKDTPVLDFAEASEMILVLVVVLDSLSTACIGM